MIFTMTFVGILIKGALLVVAASAAILITLLIIDFWKGKVW